MRYADLMEEKQSDLAGLYERCGRRILSASRSHSPRGWVEGWSFNPSACSKARLALDLRNLSVPECGISVVAHEPSANGSDFRTESRTGFVYPFESLAELDLMLSAEGF